jgi:DNA anti-recombination protein RmuC
MLKHLITLLNIMVLIAISQVSYADCGTPIECYQKALEKLERARELVKEQQAENQRLLKKQQAENERLASENQRIAHDNKRQTSENQRLVLENKRLVLENQRVVVDNQNQVAAIKSQLENRLKKIQVGNCQRIDGPCGFGMFREPTFYFDRVAYSCPDTRQILKTLQFRRCGELGTSNEGLLIRATCCQIIY